MASCLPGRLRRGESPPAQGHADKRWPGLKRLEWRRAGQKRPESAHPEEKCAEERYEGLRFPKQLRPFGRQARQNRPKTLHPERWRTCRKRSGQSRAGRHAGQGHAGRGHANLIRAGRKVAGCDRAVARSHVGRKECEPAGPSTRPCGQAYCFERNPGVLLYNWRCSGAWLPSLTRPRGHGAPVARRCVSRSRPSPGFAMPFAAYGLRLGQLKLLKSISGLSVRRWSKTRACPRQSRMVALIFSIFT